MKVYKHKAYIRGLEMGKGVVLIPQCDVPHERRKFMRPGGQNDSGRKGTDVWISLDDVL